MGMEYDFSRLRGRIREKFGSESAFSESVGFSRTTLSAKLNGKVDWDCSDVVRACDLLDVPISQAHEYFFVEKIEKTQQ